MDDLNKTDMDALIEGLSDRLGGGLSGWRISRSHTDPKAYSSIAVDVSSPVGRERLAQILDALDGYEFNAGHMTITVWSKRAPVEA